jgi:hypothetical protein
MALHGGVPPDGRELGHVLDGALGEGEGRACTEVAEDYAAVIATFGKR